MPETTSDGSVAALVGELVKLPAECEWVEFKENNAEPDKIGEYISALANAAVLADRSRAYLVEESAPLLMNALTCGNDRQWFRNTCGGQRRATRTLLN